MYKRLPDELNYLNYMKQQFEPKEVIHYYNASEFGKYLGWNRRKINVYYNRDQNGTLRHHFPEPKAFSATIPLWTKEQVKAYGEYLYTNRIVDLDPESEFMKEFMQEDKKKAWLERQRQNKKERFIHQRYHERKDDKNEDST